jgi:hypothetical protein
MLAGLTTGYNHGAAGWELKVNVSMWNIISMLFPQHAAAAGAPTPAPAAAGSRGAGGRRGGTQLGVRFGARNVLPRHQRVAAELQQLEDADEVVVEPRRWVLWVSTR